MMLSQLTVCYEGQEQDWNMYESLALFFTVGEGIVVWPDTRCVLSPLMLTKLLECGSSCGFKYPLQHLCWRMTVATGNGLTTKLTALLVDRAIISASAAGQTSSLQCEVYANFFSRMIGTVSRAFFSQGKLWSNIATQTFCDVCGKMCDKMTWEMVHW